MISLPKKKGLATEPVIFVRVKILKLLALAFSGVMFLLVYCRGCPMLYKMPDPFPDQMA